MQQMTKKLKNGTHHRLTVTHSNEILQEIK